MMKMAEGGILDSWSEEARPPRRTAAAVRERYCGTPLPTRVWLAGGSWSWAASRYLGVNGERGTYVCTFLVVAQKALAELRPRGACGTRNVDWHVIGLSCTQTKTRGPPGVFICWTQFYVVRIAFRFYPSFNSFNSTVNYSSGLSIRNILGDLRRRAQAGKPREVRDDQFSVRFRAHGRDGRENLRCLRCPREKMPGLKGASIDFRRGFAKHA
jgi:hypothetical protein